MNSLFSRLQNEKVTLEHSQAVDRFLRETDYLREKPARQSLTADKGKQAILAFLGIISMIAAAALGLLN
jgi:hypothetical protein